MHNPNEIHGQREKPRGPAALRINSALAAVIAASAATIGSFGLVISGIWVINLAVN